MRWLPRSGILSSALDQAKQISARSDGGRPRRPGLTVFSHGQARATECQATRRSLSALPIIPGSPFRRDQIDTAQGCCEGRKSRGRFYRLV